MQYKSDNNETIVYYVVAAVSIFVLISYGNSGDIPPIVGFLVTGMSVYILYPNETIALIMALIVSTILRRTGYEGMENEEEPTQNDNENENENENEVDKDKKDKLEKIQETLKNKFVPEEDTVPEKKQAFTLKPALYGEASPAPSSQDMDKLSGMIDKTMKLIEMLPDDFLKNATNK